MSRASSEQVVATFVYSLDVHWSEGQVQHDKRRRRQKDKCSISVVLSFAQIQAKIQALTWPGQARRQQEAQIRKRLPHALGARGECVGRKK